MRPTARRLAALAALIVAAPLVSRPAAPATTREGTREAEAEGAPPHAWLFGEWTGGMFPIPSGGVNATFCAGTPVVIFTRDVVLRATLTEQTYTQREIATVRSSPQGAEFRFSPAAAPAASGGLLGLGGAAGTAGFGCESPDVLHVQRRGENEIAFPNCADFPYPLVRCPGR